MWYNDHVSKKHPDIETQLKRSILNSKMSRYQIARLSGVAEAQLSYFVNNKRTLTLPVASKLAKTLGLELIETKTR